MKCVRFTLLLFRYDLLFYVFLPTARDYTTISKLKLFYFFIDDRTFFRDTVGNRIRKNTDVSGGIEYEVRRENVVLISYKIL